MAKTYLESSIQQFEYYKSLGEKTMLQVVEKANENALFWQYNDESNSIATIVKHLSGNMLSRWTDFLTSDGEKAWRNRDTEFEHELETQAEVLTVWNKGWTCLFTALNSITDDDLNTIIYIRNEPHTITEAINRQLAHYPYHIGQIVFLGKMICNENWQSLSIPKGKSANYNMVKFGEK